MAKMLAQKGKKFTKYTDDQIERALKEQDGDGSDGRGDYLRNFGKGLQGLLPMALREVYPMTRCPRCGKGYTPERARRICNTCHAANPIVSPSEFRAGGGELTDGGNTKLYRGNPKCRRFAGWK